MAISAVVSVEAAHELSPQPLPFVRSFRGIQFLQEQSQLSSRQTPASPRFAGQWLGFGFQNSHDSELLNRLPAACQCSPFTPGFMIYEF